jgi:hypothetical protein
MVSESCRLGSELGSFRGRAWFPRSGAAITPLLSQTGKPSVQDRQAAWLDRSERDPHPAVVSRIGYLALGHEVHARVRNSQSDLCSGWERSSRLNKTSEHTQVLGVRCKLLFRHDVRDLNPSNEGETLRAMPFRRDQVGDLIWIGFYSHRNLWQTKITRTGGRSDPTEIYAQQSDFSSGSRRPANVGRMVFSISVVALPGGIFRVAGGCCMLRLLVM